MTYIHPLFNSRIEEVTPPELAKALGFLIETDSFYFDDDTLESMWVDDLDNFYEKWNPECPNGYILAGKYESEDGPFALFVKPDSILSRYLWNQFPIGENND